MTRRWLAGLSVGVGLGLAPHAALAGPTGEEELNGHAVVTRDGNHTLIETTTRRTRLKWDNFDIAVDESVYAKQPNAGSVLVNQVSDASVTHIDGSLKSNGKVWILNPAGVYFGGSAIVEVAGLVAAAGEITDQGFATGLKHFTNLRGEVRVDAGGRITTTGGDVALIGRSVVNHGQIITRGGDLVMAAGDEVLLWRHDTHIQVHASNLDMNANVENTGIIDTGGGRARLAAGDFLGLAIRNTGTIRAREIALEAGAESVVEVSGVLDASDREGGGVDGHIEITGDWVSVDDAEIDASGELGGGEIWIGGEPGGGGSLPTARGTFVSADSEIRADATRNGDGGEIIVWSDEVAGVQGLLSATGGRYGGDGGFIETSSKGRIDVAADIRVGARMGRPGTWLLDPVNVAIVDMAEFQANEILGAGGILELLEFETILGTINFQPEEPPPGPTIPNPNLPPPDDVLGVSLLQVDTLVSTLEKGGIVLVSTQSLDEDQPGDADGWIEVRTPIVIPDGAAVAPNTESTLQLLAADDVRVLQRIATEDADLQLNVIMTANDNSATRGVAGQPEPADKLRNGDVEIEAEIVTGGGDIVATGTNVFVKANLDTQTSNPTSDDPGGSVTLIASDPVEAGLIRDPNDGSDPDDFGNVEIDPGVRITTGGGSFLSAGELFTMGDGAIIDVYLPPADPDAGDLGIGSVQVLHRDQVTILGDITAESMLLSAGGSGEGDLVLGDSASTPVLIANTIQLDAGDGTPQDDNGLDAQVLIAPDVVFQGFDEDGVPQQNESPETFSITQDAAITDANIPDASQFGGGVGGMLKGMFYTLSTADGATDPAAFDIVLTDYSKFTGSELVLIAPDSILLADPDGLVSPLAPRNVAISIEGDFTVTNALADNLRPNDNGDEMDGVLRILAGQSGTGNLDFEADATLVAQHIALQAGNANLSGDESSVDTTGAIFDSTGLLSFELRQDADITDDTIPEPSQFTGGIFGLDYALLSEGGSITITDAAQIMNTAITLTALDEIALNVPSAINFFSADLGGFQGFQVTQELLDNINLLPNVLGDRLLTLRAGTGSLSFQSTGEDAAGDPIDVQVAVEAERIHLVGASIDVRTGTPLFQSDDTTPTKRLIFEQDGLITNSILPTADNFPMGLGPSDLFVLQSNVVGLNLVQDAPPVLPGEDFRGWSFPVQDTTQVILVAQGIGVTRDDGFKVVLDQRDDVWGTDILLDARFPEPDPSDPSPPPQPIIPPTVDAENVNSIRGFDADIDFMTPLLLSQIQQPQDANGNKIAAGRLALVQDGDFNLRSGFGLPDLDGDPMTAEIDFQPATYSLGTTKGSIEIHNSLLANTNLVLEIESVDDQIIDFDLVNESGSLNVTSLTARMAGDFEVGASADGTEGAVVVAKDTIILESGLGARGSLSFAPSVDLTAQAVRLTGGADVAVNEKSVVDARTNSPTFEVKELSIVQTGDLISGLEGPREDPMDPMSAPDLSTLPKRGQFRDLSASTPLDLYSISTILGDVDINDPSNILIARAVEVIAGLDTPTRLTLRADMGTTGGEACVSACGMATDPNLELIGGTSFAESVLLSGREIFLEAPDGYVDAGDDRVKFALLGLGSGLAIRQGDPITIDDALRLPDRDQFLSGLLTETVVLQSRQDINVGAAVAEQLAETNLVLIAGVSEEEFEAAETGVRLEDPVPDPDPDLPDHVYDRLADANGDGIVDDLDEPTDFSQVVRINDSAQFDLILRSLGIRSGADGHIALGNVHIMTEADQTYRNAIVLEGDTEMTASSGLLADLEPTFTPPASTIIFEKTIDGQTAGDQSLTVNATRRIHFMDEIGTSARLDELTLNLEQLIQLQEEPPTPRVEFGTEDFTGTFTVAADTILLNPDSADNSSPYVRNLVPDGATFFRRGGSLEFLVGAVGEPGTFTMGVNEKISVDGPMLRIIGMDGGNLGDSVVTIGDLSALDLIEVAARDIHIQRRERGSVVRANGSKVKDGGVDFVAKQIDFQFAFDAGADPTGSVTLFRNQVGSGKDAAFGVADPLGAPGFMDEFAVLSLQFNQLLGEGLGFLGSDLGLDGVPDGISRVALARAFAPDRPDVPIAVPASQRIRKPGSLAAVGIALREPTSAELLSGARGATIYQDLGSMRIGRGDEIRVSEARLVASEVEKTSAIYERVFGVDGSRIDQVRGVLGAAIDDYKRSTGARRVVGFELRRYIYNRPSSQFEAYQELQNLDALFRHHRRSGLTPTEYESIQARWLEAVRPEGITLRELSEFVHPSRYVRGSDVLDVFGN